MNTLFGSLAILLYGASALWLARGVFLGRPRHDAPPLLPGFAAVALHAAYLKGSICCGTDGLDLNLLNALSLVAWLTALLLLVSSLRRPLHNLVMVMLPITAATVLLELVFGRGPSIEVSGGPELKIHILVSILAYALLTLAALQAAVLAVQHNSLRSGHPGGRFVRALPPLQAMESLLFQLIGLGFVVLTGSLVTGFVYLEDMFAQHVAHKTVLSVVGWVVYAILLLGRLRFGWRGRTAIRWTLGGFAILLVAYFGTKLVLEWILGVATT